MRSLVLPLLALLSLVGCKEDTPAADLLAGLGRGIDWTVTEIAGSPVPAGVTVTLRVPEAGMIAGTSGCNRYSGRTETREGALHIGALAGTRMMCPPEQMAVEQAFHSTIGQAKAVQQEGSTLALTDATGKVLIRARR